MKKTLVLLLHGLLCVSVTSATAQDPNGLQPFAYRSQVVGNISGGLPADLLNDGAARCLISVDEGGIRFRIDGVDVTAADGHYLGPGSVFDLNVPSYLVGFRAIRAGTTDSTLRITCSKWMTSTGSTTLQQFGFVDASGTHDLVSIQGKATLTEPQSGQDFGRGAIRLTDHVSNRRLELGFYRDGSGIFTKGNPGEPFEFWIDSGVLAVKGNSNTPPLRHRFELRVPSDADGLNLEAGYSLRNGLFGGHIGMWYPNEPLYVQIQDGTGLTFLPGGQLYTGGRHTVGRPSEFQILAGNSQQVSDLSFGYWVETGQFDTVRWKLRRKQDDMFGIVYWPNGEEDTSRSTYFTKKGFVGIGTASAINARLTVAGNIAVTAGDGLAPDAGFQRGRPGVLRFTNGAAGNGTWQVGDPGTKPSCNTGLRGTFWLDFGGVGASDTVEICVKDKADSYSWRQLD